MATYFSHQERIRMKENLRTGPAYGPPAPYPFQRQGDLSRGGLGRATPPRNPKFLEQKMGQTFFQEFRPGVSLPGYKGAAKTVVRLGLQAAVQRNPYFRTAKMAFDVAYSLNWNNDVAYLAPGLPDRVEVPDGYSCIKWYGPLSNPLECGGAVRAQTYSWNANCNYFPAEPFYEPAFNDLHNAWVAGPVRGGIYTCQRFSTAVVVHYPNTHRNGGRTREQFRYHLATPPRAMPAPLARPNPAVSQETFTPLPRGREDDDVLPRERLRPYERPAVDVVVSPGGRRTPPGHFPSVVAIHNQLPPGPGMREKKSTPIGASKGAKAIYALYNAATEAHEIMDILYDNLGKKCKGAKNMFEKGNCVYQNLHTLDVNQAINDLILNHYEDQLWGRFFGLGKGLPFGVQLPGATQPRVNLSQRT